MTLIEQSIKEAQEEFMKSFKCIQNNCDGNGTISALDDEGDLVPEQCQYCDQVRFPARDSIATHMHKLAKELREATQVEEKRSVHFVEKYPATNLDDMFDEALPLCEAAQDGYNQCRTDINNKWDKI